MFIFSFKINYFFSFYSWLNDIEILCDYVISSTFLHVILYHVIFSFFIRPVKLNSQTSLEFLLLQNDDTNECPKDILIKDSLLRIQIKHLSI